MTDMSSEPPRRSESREAKRIRTGEWVNANDPVGQAEDALVVAAAQHDIQVRALSRDGEVYLTRGDLRPNRLNVVVEGGLVTEFDGIY